MRSRANVRSAGEWVLRAALVVALGVALWRSLSREVSSSVARPTTASALERELRTVITSPAITSVDLAVDAMPSRTERDALSGLRRAGVQVRWHGAPPTLAIEAARVREPDERVRLLVHANRDASLALVDSAGLLDSVRAMPGATVEATSVVGRVYAKQGMFGAAAVAPPSTPRRAVLVLGGADWETTFVMAALTEAGWTVRVRIPTAPRVMVRDEAILPLDTARYDVVIALDSSADDLRAAIARFVADGGGLVSGATALARDRALAPATAQARRPGRILLADDSVTPRDLPVRALVALRSDALSLERVPAGITLAARRAGLGRVLAVGYDESWRWRMLGGQSGLAAHRRWWSRAAGAVAPERDGEGTHSGDGAPLAALIEALGEPSRSGLADAPSSRDPLPLSLLLLISAALLAEVASRRFRGAP